MSLTTYYQGGRICAKLQDLGPSLRMPFSRAVSYGIFELRIQQGNNIARIFYFFQKGGTIVLTHGYIKKDQNTPRSEIQRAINYRAEYERRNRNGQI